MQVISPTKHVSLERAAGLNEVHCSDRSTQREEEGEAQGVGGGKQPPAEPISVAFAGGGPEEPAVMAPRKRLALLLLLLVSAARAGGHGAAALQSSPMDGSDLDTLAGTIGNHNGVRCPWACNCGGQELDCAHRGLTQVPGNLAALTLSEKL